MGMIDRSRVCLVPNVSGVGGMVSFRGRLMKGLSRRAIPVSTSLSDTPYSTILVIGGTRNLPGLWRAKRRGVRIVQRLDGMNWIHRRRKTGWRHYLRAEYGNLVLSFTRSRLADHIVYQSEFSRQWWERVYQPTRSSWSVVHNGVDLTIFTPTGPGEPPQDRIRILMVEGAIAGGYEWGLETGIRMVEQLKAARDYPLELVVAGRVSQSLRREWELKAGIPLHFAGVVPFDNVPELDRSAHLLYAADINAACPNSVIEALACGLPVVGFDTGALPELVTSQAGSVVPYGGDVWKLEPPNIVGLAEAARTVINEQARLREGARARAEQAFSLDKMVDGYLDALNL